MPETELKISITPAEAKRLLASPLLAELRAEPRRTETMVSIYHDTPDHALAAAGMSLRLRRVGRRWVRTVKSAARATGPGLFAHEEFETPAPGGRLRLDGPDPEGALAAVTAACAGAVPEPVFETRIKRVIERLRLPGGGEAELAVDAGAVVAGEAEAPISEAELELLSGPITGLYDLAKRLFPAGPVRFASLNKAARGYGLLRGKAEPALKPRKAGAVAYDPAGPVELGAATVLRDCLAQIADNLVVVAETEMPEGPHQLRIGLRRLRSAFRLFGPSLGAAAFVPLNDAARDLGQVVGRLRDLDVLMGEVVVDIAAEGLDDAARDALLAALGARRAQVRAEVRAVLAGPAVTGFVFDLGRLVEARGWLDPGDYGQTARLAAPVAEVAGDLLDRAYRRVRKHGKDVRERDAEGLHELRKTLKTLRYTAEMLDPVHPGDAPQAFIGALRKLQDIFGSRNDAAMAEAMLSVEDAPGRHDAAAQRATGWVLGVLAERMIHDTPILYERWDAFRKANPYWR